MKTKIYHSILEIDRDQWQAIQPDNFPFCSYEFLAAMETSKSIGRRTGWFPVFITLWNNEELIGASYLYLKTNSYGEYIFDWAWADAWQRSGLQYYPKLLSAAPFTPATGTKLLVKNENQAAAVKLLEETKKFAEKENLSTIHHLFIPEKEISSFEEAGFTIRKTYQFHWKNNNYQTFEDFLMALKQKKRKDVRRERKLLSNEDLEIKLIPNEEISLYSDLMYDFYLSTIDKKWSSDYLTKEFFEKIFTEMKKEIILFIAFKENSPIAATLNFRKGEALFGRYWGCTEDIPNLHFELCYYRPIEYAIENKIKLFEAGAQGEHKIQRGFIPSFTYSAHYLPEHQLGDAVRDYIAREAKQVEKIISEGHGMAYK